MKNTDVNIYKKKDTMDEIVKFFLLELSKWMNSNNTQIRSLTDGEELVEKQDKTQESDI